MEILRFLLGLVLLLVFLYIAIISTVMTFRHGYGWWRLEKAWEEEAKIRDRLTGWFRDRLCRIKRKRNQNDMKTVTIYTDGGAAHRAGAEMSGRLAPDGVTGGHGRQAPSEGRAA